MIQALLANPSETHSKKKKKKSKPSTLPSVTAGTDHQLS